MTAGLQRGVGYRLRLTNITERPGVELFPVIEVVGHMHRSGRDRPRQVSDPGRVHRPGSLGRDRPTSNGHQGDLPGRPRTGPPLEVEEGRDPAGFDQPDRRPSQGRLGPRPGGRDRPDRRAAADDRGDRGRCDGRRRARPAGLLSGRWTLSVRRRAAALLASFLAARPAPRCSRRPAPGCLATNTCATAATEATAPGRIGTEACTGSNPATRWSASISAWAATPTPRSCRPTGSAFTPLGSPKSG